MVKFSAGEKHIALINDKYQCFGMGESSFGQLGYMNEDQTFSNTAIPILDDQMIEEVFCTPFCTFLVNSNLKIIKTRMKYLGAVSITEDSLGWAILS